MNCSSSLTPSRAPKLLPLLVLLLFMFPNSANAGEVTWTGADGTDWSEHENWDPAVPGQDDVAVIPLVSNQPVISTPDTLCAGIILYEGATLTIEDSGNPLAPYALYIIGAGDLDGDGASDIQERDQSIIAMSFDIDGDGFPNFADSDSDDGLSIAHSRATTVS